MVKTKDADEIQISRIIKIIVRSPSTALFLIYALVSLGFFSYFPNYVSSIRGNQTLSPIWIDALSIGPFSVYMLIGVLIAVKMFFEIYLSYKVEMKKTKEN